MKFKAIRYAVHPADISRIEQLPGISGHVAHGIPAEGETITNPFLVDPQSKTPVPVTVSQVLLGYPSPDLVTVVVTRQH